MEEELKVTVKSAIMFEELTGKDYLNAGMTPEDMLTFMYCVFCTSVQQVSQNAFTEMLSDQKFADRISNEWLHYSRFVDQFKQPAKESVVQDDAPESISMKRIAQALIFKYGLDPDFVLNKVDLWELNYLIEIGEGAYRDQMEEKRMWAFIQLTPHIDKKKGKNMTAEKLIQFPWESPTATKEGRERELKKETERAKSTIGMQIKL